MIKEMGLSQSRESQHFGLKALDNIVVDRLNKI